MKTLILFASRYGATEEIAYMLKSAVGGDVTVCNVCLLYTSPSPRD